MLDLLITKNSQPHLRGLMEIHYSHPEGFVARNICYAIFWNQQFYGYITGGSATKYLPKRNDYFGIDQSNLNNIINNQFFHIERHEGLYPIRNFVMGILALWRDTVARDWEHKYGDKVIGFETLVEPPRTGQSYLRDGWKYLAETKGYTCKRVAGRGTDSWSGKRVWNTKELHPKLIFARKV